MSSARFDDLLNGFLDERLSEAELAELNGLLAQDAVARKAFIRSTDLHLALRERFGAEAHVPQIHVGAMPMLTGARRSVSSKGSRSISLRFPRRNAVETQKPVWPFALAACVLLGVALAFVANRPSITGAVPVAKLKSAMPVQNVAPDHAKAEETRRKAALENRRARIERLKAEEDLVQLEHECDRLLGAQHQEARREELARVEASRVEAEVRLRSAQEKQIKAEDALALAEETLPGEPVASDGQVAQVIFVRQGAGAQPMLVRGTERLALSNGLAVLAGDRIETGGLSTGAASPLAVAAALELFGGATVDLAQGTTFEVSGYGRGKLTDGLVYAHVDTVMVGKANTQEVVLQTSCADVVARKGRFDLMVGGGQVLLRVAEGKASIFNAQGKHEVGALQQSAARVGAAPAAPSALVISDLWAGRSKFASATAFRQVLLAWDFEKPEGLNNWVSAAYETVHTHAGSKGALRAKKLEDQEHFTSGAFYQAPRSGPIFTLTEKTTLRFAFYVSQPGEVKIHIVPVREERKKIASSVAWIIGDAKSGTWHSIAVRIGEVFKDRAGFGQPVPTGLRIKDLEFYAGENGMDVELYLDDLAVTEGTP